METIPNSSNTIAPITEVPMLEVPAENKEDVIAAFERLAAHEIPAFVLRAAGVVFEDNSERGRVTHMQQLAIDAASAVTGQAHEVTTEVPITSGPGSTEVGLHADASRWRLDREKPQYHIHTTVTEKPARIKAALPGPELESPAVHVRADKRLQELYAQGLTDTRHIDPTFHVADAANGDTVIFPTNFEPTWHDVTAPEGTRTSVISSLSQIPERVPLPKRRGG